MPRRTRIGSTPDIGRLSAALARPGMDTRTWVAHAYALGEQFLDEHHGSFVKVVVAPTGEEITARVPSPYAGNHFGLHLGQIHEQDELLVEIPLGDPAEGASVVARHWNAADLPSQEAIDNPDEVVWVIETDKTFRLITKGTGKVFIDSADTVTLIAPHVQLGADETTPPSLEQVSLGTVWRAKEQAMHQSLQTALAALAGLITTAGSSLTTAGPLTLLPPAGVAIAAAGAALTSAVTQVTALQTAIATYETEAAANQNLLSNTTKTKR